MISVLTDQWEGLYTALAIKKAGGDVSVVYLTPKDRGLQTIFIGNGDPFEVVYRTFGSHNAQAFWGLSEQNYTLALSAFQQWGIAFDDSGMKRELTPGLDTELAQITAQKKSYRIEKTDLVEPALSFCADECRRTLLTELTKVGVATTSFDSLPEIKTKGFSEFEIDGKKASVLVVFSDRRVNELVPELGDKLIPVALSSFLFEPNQPQSAALSLFNRGADFAIQLKEQLKLGSFRNLFQDKAVGIHDTTDPVTLASVQSFLLRAIGSRPPPHPKPRMFAQKPSPVTAFRSLETCPTSPDCSWPAVSPEKHLTTPSPLAIP